MNIYSIEELEKAQKIVSSILNRCEKMQSKFMEGTSQHTLLQNRIKAMYISKAMIASENIQGIYSKEDLVEALQPISSIISKCTKAQVKYSENTTNYNRFENMIKAMNISKSLIELKLKQAKSNN